LPGEGSFTGESLNWKCKILEIWFRVSAKWVKMCKNHLRIGFKSIGSASLEDDSQREELPVMFIGDQNQFVVVSGSFERAARPPQQSS
jgi:hypothetical protein